MKNPFAFFDPRRAAREEAAGARAEGPPGASAAAAGAPGGAPAALDVVRAYHAATMHHFHRYARGPGELDWATQPDPFRRYAGAEVVALEHVPLDEGPAYDEVFGVEHAQAGPPALLDRKSLSQLLLDALGLSAWKQYGSSTWALRCNPSSGNLHPTEAHVVAPAIEGIAPAPFVAHYAPREHALELRARLAPEAFAALARGLPAGTFFVGLASVHWREAWKYGERAYRYCQHDAGHAIGSLAVAAAALGWRVELCDDLGRDDLAALLGLGDPRGVEAEEPDVLLAVVPGTSAAVALPSALPPELAATRFAGLPNALSPDHVHWDAIEAVAEACRKPRTAGAYAREELPPALAWPAPPRAAGLRRLVHQRRSAVDFDGTTGIDRADFLRMLAATQRGVARVLPWRPRVHFALFVHRVRDLEPGLYVLARDPAERPLLQAAFEKPFVWERVEPATSNGVGLELYRLHSADLRGPARAVSCHQDIAGDGTFSLGMLARFEPSLAEHGAWFYPRLYWECGLVGQILYLEAEAAGVRATGIGCYFDDGLHDTVGLSSARWRSLYHFTVGGPVDDARLQTWPAYPPRDRPLP